MVDETARLFIIGCSHSNNAALVQRLTGADCSSDADIGSSPALAGYITVTCAVWCGPERRPCAALKGLCDIFCAAGLLTLDTKYYTAAVHIHVATPGELAPQSVLPAHDAQVLVFDAADEASLRAVTGWAERYSAAGAAPEPEIKLCIAILAAPADVPDGTASADASAAHRPAWLQGGRDWASDHLFEYVEACVSSPALDAALRLDDAGAEVKRVGAEQQGLSRILEALGANMWPGLCMKPQPGSRGQLAAATAEALPSAATPVANSTSTHSEHTNGAASEIIACNGGGSSGVADSCAGREAVLQPPRVESAANSARAASAGVLSGEEAAAAAAAVDSGGCGGEILQGSQILAFRELLAGEGGGTAAEALNAEEAQTEQLAQLMTSFSGARERLQGMPDDERRQAAERIALQMMQAFGIEDADSESDS